jgi:hypothetical protein
MEFCVNKKTLRLLASGFACFDKIENRPSRPPVRANNHNADDVGGEGQIDQRCGHVRLGKFSDCVNKARIAGGGDPVKLSRTNHVFNAWRIIIFHAVALQICARILGGLVRKSSEHCAMRSKSLRDAGANVCLPLRIPRFALTGAQAPV